MRVPIRDTCNLFRGSILLKYATVIQRVLRYNDQTRTKPFASARRAKPDAARKQVWCVLEELECLPQRKLLFFYSVAAIRVKMSYNIPACCKARFTFSRSASLIDNSGARTTV